MVLVLLVLNLEVFSSDTLSGAHYITLAHSQEMEFKAAEQWDHDRGVSGGQESVEIFLLLLFW